jgi:hypothetical protein
VPSAQELIDKLKGGPAAACLKAVVLVLAVAALGVTYNWRAYRNMATLEAMDGAQVARNLSEGKGFTTLCIRPLSVYLLTNHNAGVLSNAPPGGHADPAQLQQMHPDLANPPVYPLVLAGLMKELPFDWDIPNVKANTTESRAYFWNHSGRFWWYPPDFFIALFNQILLVLVVVGAYLLARKMFDSRVALLTAVLTLGADLLWRFSVSGLSTLLLMLLFLALVRCLLALETGVRAGTLGPIRELLLVILVGVLVAVGALTRYSYGVLLLPAVVFVGLYSGKRRFFNGGLVLNVFLLVCAPWIVRNFSVSGTPLGTATYAFMETSPLFPADTLQRSLAPELDKFEVRMVWRKCLSNGRTLVSTDLPKLAGSWVSAFFLVGLLLQFRDPAINRLKYFLLAALVMLGLAQILGRTQSGAEAGEVSAENLLVLVAPLVLLYGAALYRVLRDQLLLPAPDLRYAVDGLFIFIATVPLLLSLLPPRTSAVVYPPYYNPLVQRVSKWMQPGELMMSDVPWAVAWVGRRQCLWTTLNPGDQFQAVDQQFKRVRALYLTPRTTDQRLVSGWVQTSDKAWGGLVLEVALRREVPASFPLHQAPEGFPIPDQIFLSDRERWRSAAPGR